MDLAARNDVPRRCAPLRGSPRHPGRVLRQHGRGRGEGFVGSGPEHPREGHDRRLDPERPERPQVGQQVQPRRARLLQQGECVPGRPRFREWRSELPRSDLRRLVREPRSSPGDERSSRRSTRPVGAVGRLPDFAGRRPARGHLLGRPPWRSDRERGPPLRRRGHRGGAVQLGLLLQRRDGPVRDRQHGELDLVDLRHVCHERASRGDDRNPGGGDDMESRRYDLLLGLRDRSRRRNATRLGSYVGHRPAPLCSR